mgnify:CR=1 FL=1
MARTLPRGSSSTPSACRPEIRRRPSIISARATPSAAELLRRLAEARNLAGVGPLLVEWERWAAELLESHLSYPVLCYFRSQHDNQSWLAALTAKVAGSLLSLHEAARLVAMTYSDLPVAWLGSTITGRCVSSLRAGIAPMSSVNRVAVFLRKPDGMNTDGAPSTDDQWLRATQAIGHERAKTAERRDWLPYVCRIAIVTATAARMREKSAETAKANAIQLTRKTQRKKRT